MPRHFTAAAAAAFGELSDDFLKLTRASEVPIEHYRDARQIGLETRSDVLVGVLGRLQILLNEPRTLTKSALEFTIRNAIEHVLEDHNAKIANLISDAPKCGRCQVPFDPEDKRHDGQAESGTSGFCRKCVDRCHESTDAFHSCVICLRASA